MSNQKQLEELLKNITRIEIIDSNGRTYVNWLKDSASVFPMLQDNNRTLKLFLNTSNDKS